METGLPLITVEVTDRWIDYPWPDGVWTVGRCPDPDCWFFSRNPDWPTFLNAKNGVVPQDGGYIPQPSKVQQVGAAEGNQGKTTTDGTKEQAQAAVEWYAYEQEALAARDNALAELATVENRSLVSNIKRPAVAYTVFSSENGWTLILAIPRAGFLSLALLGSGTVLEEHLNRTYLTELADRLGLPAGNVPAAKLPPWPKQRQRAACLSPGHLSGKSGGTAWSGEGTTGAFSDPMGRRSN
ncbi:hypothetical protein V3F56_09075 [Moorellaceae bacterium AZ2]